MLGTQLVLDRSDVTNPGSALLSIYNLEETYIQYAHTNTHAWLQTSMRAMKKMCRVQEQIP